MIAVTQHFFLNWSEAFVAGPKIVGGKGWNLGRLKRYGFKIPVGATLSTTAYEYFISENKLLDSIEAISQTATIDNIQEESSAKQLDLIRNQIRAGEIPSVIRDELKSTLQELNIFNKSLAVRSSASTEDSSAHSFAGIHDSVLNVIGLNSIILAIKECYASLWTSRAVAYRRKMKVPDQEMLLGIVIQEMVQAQAAGIGFSCDPREGQREVIVINANYGLGESVVGGIIQPDEYYLDYNPKLAIPTVSLITIGRKEGITTSKEDGGTHFTSTPDLAGKQVLSKKSIEQLGLIILRTFDALGQGIEHQDIEWVFNGNEFVLVQARPVTALTKRTYPELRDQPEIWSNGNIRDGLPMVMSELTWSVGQSFFDSLLNAYLRAVRYPILPGLETLKRFQGRAYANLSLMQWSHYNCFGIRPSETNTSFGGHQPEIQIDEKGPFYGLKGLKRLGRTLQLLLILTRTKKNVDKSFATVEKYTWELRKKEWQNLQNQEFLTMYNDILMTTENYLPTFSFMTVSAAYSNQKLVDHLEKYFPSKGNSKATAVLVGGGQITSAQHGYRLLELAQMVRDDSEAKKYFSSKPFNPLEWESVLSHNSLFRKGFKEFLEVFGHRAVYEYEIMNSRWREDPSYLLDIIKNSIETADLNMIQAQQKTKTNQVWEEIRKTLPFYQRAIVKYWAKEASKGAELREMSKSMFVKFFEPLRMMFEEIGRRLEDRVILEHKADVYFCTWSELASILCGEWGGAGLKELVVERMAKKKKLESLNPPDFIIDDIPNFSKPVNPTSGKVLTGLGVSSGKASGIAKLITHPFEGTKLEFGDILVAPSTDPGWTPLFLKVSGIVMETGGFLSHGAIVAREYGIPSVVNIPGAMAIINNGLKITVDGDKGQVIL